MKILCDRCKREFDSDDETVYNPVTKRIEIICPDCEEDADI